MASDRDLFEKLIAQSDPYSPYQGVANAINFTPTRRGQETTAIGVGLGKALIAGLLKGKSKSHRLEQTGLLNDLYRSGSLDTEIEGLDPIISGGVRRQALADELERKVERRDALSLKLDMMNLEETGQLPGSAATILPSALTSERRSSSLKSPKVQRELDKIEREKTKQKEDTSKVRFDQEQKLKADFTKISTAPKGGYIKRVEDFEAALEAYKDTGGTSDYELIRRGAQAIEQGLAVRQDDERSIQSAASLFGLTAAKIRQLAEGGTSLDPKVRKGILRQISRAIVSAGENYDIGRASILDSVEAYDLGADRVVPFGASSISPYAPDQQTAALMVKHGLDPEILDPVGAEPDSSTEKLASYFGFGGESTKRESRSYSNISNAQLLAEAARRRK